MLLKAIVYVSEVVCEVDCVCVSLCVWWTDLLWGGGQPRPSAVEGHCVCEWGSVWGRLCVWACVCGGLTFSEAVASLVPVLLKAIVYVSEVVCEVDCVCVWACVCGGLTFSEAVASLVPVLLKAIVYVSEVVCEVDCVCVWACVCGGLTFSEAVASLVPVLLKAIVYVSEVVCEVDCVCEPVCVVDWPSLRRWPASSQCCWRPLCMWVR